MSLRGERPAHERRWGAICAGVVTGIALSSVLWIATLPAEAPIKRVALAPGDVILAASDIPDLGWGLRACGSNETGVWRLFSGHNELLLAFLNVTLWVAADSKAAAKTFIAIEDHVAFPTQEGGVPGADASLFWYEGTAPRAAMLVRRYNVVFVLSAYLESSWNLTRSDLITWASWQLARIEASAA